MRPRKKLRKFHQKPQKSTKSRKSEAAKAVVLARSATGASNSQIAREMGIDRETVSRILSEPEIAAVIQQGKNDVVRMVPKAVGVVDDALDKKNAKVAMGVLTGVGVLKPDGGYGGSGITLNITMDPRPRAVHIPTIPRRDETLISQDSQPEQGQRELSQGTAPPEKSRNLLRSRRAKNGAERTTYRDSEFGLGASGEFSGRDTLLAQGAGGRDAAF